MVETDRANGGAVRGVSLFMLSLGAVSLLSAVVIAAASGLTVMAVTLGIACGLLTVIGIALVRRLDDTGWGSDRW